MPVLLFKLNQVLDEEADEVRALLNEAGVEFYETSAGRWGVSVAGIWLPDGVDPARPRELLAEYQQARQQRVRAEIAEQQAQGNYEGFWQRLARRPLQMLMLIGVILLVLYISIVPLLSVGR